MATRVGRGKIQLAAFDGPFLKTSTTDVKNLADISHTNLPIGAVISQKLCETADAI